MNKLWVFVLAVALVSGCAFNPQTVKLQPKVSSPHSSEGQGVLVAVRVVDNRALKSLGHRGTMYSAAAEITSNTNLAKIVRTKVVQSLRNQGFIVTSAGADSNAKLTVKVRLLRYSTSTGFWTGGVQVQAAVKAVATKSGKKYQKMYRTNEEHRVVVVPTAGTNAAWINASLGDVITKLVSDAKLISFLAG